MGEYYGNERMIVREDPHTSAYYTNLARIDGMIRILPKMGGCMGCNVMLYYWRLIEEGPSEYLQKRVYGTDGHDRGVWNGQGRRVGFGYGDWDE